MLHWHGLRGLCDANEIPAVTTAAVTTASVATTSFSTSASVAAAAFTTTVAAAAVAATAVAAAAHVVLQHLCPRRQHGMPRRRGCCRWRGGFIDSEIWSRSPVRFWYRL